MKWLDVWCLLIRLDIRTSGQRQGKRFAEGLREDAWIWRQDSHSYPPKFSEPKMPWNWNVSVGSMAVCVCIWKTSVLQTHGYGASGMAGMGDMPGLGCLAKFDAAMALLLVSIYSPEIWHGTWKWWFPKRNHFFQGLSITSSMWNFRDVLSMTNRLLDCFFEVLSQWKWMARKCWWLRPPVQLKWWKDVTNLYVNLSKLCLVKRLKQTPVTHRVRGCSFSAKKIPQHFSHRHQAGLILDPETQAPVGMLNPMTGEAGEWKMQSRSCHVNIYVVIVVLILIDNRVFEKTFHTDSAYLNLLDPDAQARLISNMVVYSSIQHVAKFHSCWQVQEITEVRYSQVLKFELLIPRLIAFDWSPCVLCVWHDFEVHEIELARLSDFPYLAVGEVAMDAVQWLIVRRR